MNKHITQQHKDQNVKTINMAPKKAQISRKENQKLLDDNILDLIENSNSKNLTLETDKMFFGRTEASEDQNAKSFHKVNEGTKNIFKCLYGIILLILIIDILITKVQN